MRLRQGGWSLIEVVAAIVVAAVAGVVAAMLLLAEYRLWGLTAKASHQAPAALTNSGARIADPSLSFADHQSLAKFASASPASVRTSPPLRLNFRR